MENSAEIERLELKTDETALVRQLLWAGLKPGMRVADVGCGPGKTTSIIKKVTGKNGNAVGIDFSQERIDYAKERYGGNGLDFYCRNVFDDLSDLGNFDFIWSRFFLEYHKKNCFEIIKNLNLLLKPGGVICLADLDYNCLSHFGLSPKLENTIIGILNHLENYHDFDPYVGRKLYSYVYDLGYQNIDVMMEPHHLIFGDLNQVDAYNWYKKAMVAGKKSGYSFCEYEGGFDEFLEDYDRFFTNPRRFTYTPLIAVKGVKPQN